MAELLDYVNEHDEVIGQATKAEIKINGWACRIIQVFIVNDEGKIVLQWRAAHKDHPHVFDGSVAGHVDAGETYDKAAHREMMEEMGLEGDLTFVSKIYNDEVNKFGQFYVIKHNGPFTNWELEAERLEWFTLDELEQQIKRFPYIFTGGLKDSFKAYKKFIES